jgi:hypothetical protein
MKKFGIVGTRSFCDLESFNKVLNKVVSLEGMPSHVVSGGAKGPDSMAQEWALGNNIATEIYIPNFDGITGDERRWKPNKDRNTLIAENSDLLIAFWDMKSGGTKDTLKKSMERRIKIYRFNTIEKKLNLIYEGIETLIDL